MTWHVDIEHIAGIVDGRATVEPGLNAVRASNWRGKSSFVEAIETALGVSAPLTEGADRGRVHVRLPDGEIEVELRRRDGGIERLGTPYLTDEYDVVRAELFACLDETNEIRRAVRTGESLEELLLRPLDFEDIEGRIADLQRERERVEAELAQAEEARRRLPAITEKETRLESELEELRARKDELASEDGGEDVRSVHGDLAQVRSELERTESRIERLEGSIERTESRLSERRAEHAAVEVDGGDVESELAGAREELDALKRDEEVLRSVYSATELVLEENRLDLVTDVDRGLDGDTVLCWTCGSEAGREDVEERLDALGERIAAVRGRVESRRDEVEKLEARREEIAQSRRRKRDLEAEVADLEEKLADRRQRLEEARERRERARERLAEVSEAVDERVEEVTDVESDIKYREAELKEARDERESLQRRADRVETLTAERESLGEEIEALRNRRDEIRYGTREAFDAAMADVLDRFDAGFESARLTPDFELVVARDGGEASLDALSEGELELLGFVAALAGYESFDVAETVPVMLVDGVGGLDEDNHHRLVEYLRDRAEYLVFTAYPEYGEFDGREIDPGDWSIATDRGATTP